MEPCQGQTGLIVSFRQRNSTSIECFHSRDQWASFSTKQKENASIRIEFSPQRTSWVHQYGRRSFVWGHQHGRRDVTWKHSTRQLKSFFDTIFNKDHAYTTPGATYLFLKTGLSSCVGLEVMMNISGGRNCSTSDWFSLSDLCENLAIIPRARVGYQMVNSQRGS